MDECMGAWMHGVDGCMHGSVDGCMDMGTLVGHNHHFHCNSIGVIRVCTAHWCWYGALHMWPKGLETVECHRDSGSNRQVLAACVPPQGWRQLSLKDSKHSFGHPKLIPSGLDAGGEGKA